MEDIEQKTKAGIKNFKFTASGTNGTSHRLHADKKKKNHLNNAKLRAELYSTYQGEKGWKSGSSDSLTWHAKIKSLSEGTA